MAFNPMNPMMANQGMYPGMGMGEGFAYPGAANSMHPGYMPYFWYYNPANQTAGTESNQTIPQQPQIQPQNSGMPFIPYPMPYYVNPMTYQQGEPAKEDATGKARKNNYYSTPTGYPGINQTVKNNLILFLFN